MRLREPGEPRVFFFMDEFAALGHLSIIETTWALVRGYGIQLVPV
jgi:type IV secretory pathway TraG/TraD family ATPase VirD4